MNLKDVAMAEAAEQFKQANEELQGWLDRLITARAALREFSGYHGQPPRFGEVWQWFHEIPEGAVITVTPAPGVSLEGGHYAAPEHGMRDARIGDPRYTHDSPFVGGAAIRACLTDRNMQSNIWADLICTGVGIGNEPAVFSEERPNANYYAAAVVIPDELRPQVAIAIVDGSAQPIGQAA